MGEIGGDLCVLWIILILLTAPDVPGIISLLTLIHYIGDIQRI